MRWEGVGGEETQVPVEVDCHSGHSVLLAPLSLPSCLTRPGKRARANEASRRPLGHFRWVIFKGSFALLQYPRTTGCSLSTWLLSADSVAAHSTQTSSLVTQRKQPRLLHNTFHSFLQLILPPQGALA